jgi:SAM-dependent MidA family methyltransferase
LSEANADAGRMAGMNELDTRIRAAIDAHGGSIDFTQFMEMALYEPELGYYVRSEAAIGAPGDFVTAPEMTHLFGAALARQAQQVLQEVGGGIVELGPGTGKLAFDLLTHLPESAWPEHYTLVERSPALREQQSRRLAQLPAALRSRIIWRDTVPVTRGLLLANEVLDALCVQCFRTTVSTILPLRVAAGAQGFGFVEGGPDPALEAWWQDLTSRLELEPEPGYQSERCVDLDAALAPWTEPLEQGLALFVDYGYPEHEYYHWDRHSGTLLCHHRHQVHADPFVHVGQQDITASVDFTAAARVLQRAGMRIDGFCSQAWFLLGCGLETLLLEVQQGDPATALQVGQSVKRLLLPGEMGDRIQVLGASRGCDIEWLGFKPNNQLGRLVR